MRFLAFAVIVAGIMFFGFFTVNYYSQNYIENVVLHEVVLPEGVIIPVGMFALGDSQQNIKSFINLQNSDDYEVLSELKSSLLILDSDSDFKKEEYMHLRQNNSYLANTFDFKDLSYDEVYSKALSSLDFGYNAFYFYNLVKEDKQNIILLSNKLKARNLNSLIIIDATPELIRDKELLNYIDAILVENLFYKENELQNNIDLLNIVALSQSKGKTILALDYSSNLNSQCNFINNAKANHFIPFVASDDLDYIPNFYCEQLNFAQ